ncbi:MAG: GNAT family N-acetyltransferase [Lachnotalea sp.]
MEILFELAKDSDLQNIITCRNKAFYLDFVKYGECPGYNRTYDSMCSIAKEATLYKIVVDNQIVGDFSVKQISENEYHLSCLCVIPEYENKGIGKKAMAFMEETYKEATKWTLNTPVDKERNHYFYKKCGFHIIDETVAGNVKVVLFEKIIE